MKKEKAKQLDLNTLLQIGFGEITNYKESNREAILEYLFQGTVVQREYRKFLPTEKKEASDYLCEVFDSKEKKKRGSIGFLENFSEEFARNPSELQILTAHLLKILKRDEDPDIDRRILEFIDSVYPGEVAAASSNGKGYRSYVCYLLLLIRNRLVHNISGSSSKEETANILSLLLVAALLRDRFPLKLLKNSIDQQYSETQLYQVTALWNSIEINLSALSLYISTQEDFLEEVQIQIQSLEIPGLCREPVKFIQNYYDQCILEMLKTDCTLDYTDVDALCRRYELVFEPSVSSFLHNVAFHMADFARSGMKQIMDYMKIYAYRPEQLTPGIRYLLEAYRKCLLHMKNIVCWNLAYFHAEMISGTEEDFQEFMQKFIPPEVTNPLIFTSDNLDLLQNSIKNEQEKFRTAVRSVKNNDIFIQFPKPFSSSHLEALQSMPEAPVFRVLEYQETDMPERNIVDTFFSVYEHMDSRFSMRRQMLCFLEKLSFKNYPAWANEKEKICNLIQQSRELLLKEALLPPIILGNKFVESITKRGIRYIEFQASLNVGKTFLIDFYISYGFLLKALPTSEIVEEDYKKHLSFAWSHLRSSLEYIQQMIPYFFVNWKNENRDYLLQQLQQLSEIHISSDVWTETRKEAEQNIMKSLDKEEEDLYEYETEIMKGKNEILLMRAELEQKIRGKVPLW